MKKELFLVLCTLVLAVSCKGKSSEKTPEVLEISEPEKTVRKLPEFTFYDFMNYSQPSMLSTLRPWSKVCKKGSFVFSEFINGVLTRKWVYENGLIISNESYERDETRTEYLYDNENRISEVKNYDLYLVENSMNLNSTSRYFYTELPENISELQYFRNDQLSYTLQKQILEDCILFVQIYSESDKHEYKVYFDEYDRVFQIENTDYYNSKKSDTSEIIEFSYDENGNILKIINLLRNNYGIGKDWNIPWKNYGTIIEYDDKGNPVKETSVRYDKTSGEEKIESSYLYSDFDSYGHWQKVEHYYENQLKETRIRKIESESTQETNLNKSNEIKNGVNSQKEIVLPESFLENIKENGIEKSYSASDITKRELSVPENSKLKIYYTMETKDAFDVVTGILFYLVQNENESFLGSYSNEFGLLDSENEILSYAELSFEKSFFQKNVKGINGAEFLESPLRLSALVTYSEDSELSASDCTDILDIDMEKMSIKRWFPEF